MNRRIVLVDKEETPQYVKYYGCCLQNEIYTLQNLEITGTKVIETLGPGDGVMIVGSRPFDFFKRFWHLGIRNENTFDCIGLERLSAENGIFVKVLDKETFPTLEEINYFLSPEFTKINDYSWFKQKVLHTIDEAFKFLDWVDSLPQDEDLGFDYETSGMPLEKIFYISGVSICNLKFGGFISFTDIKRTATEEEMAQLNKRLGDTLTKRMDHLWAYNMQFEFQVSHRCFGVDLYNLCDSSVINVLDGWHLKKYSLKFTVQRVLPGTQAWDTDFDRLGDLMDSMFFEVIGKLKKDKHKVIKVTEQDYDKTSEWKEIMKRYPEYEAEFRQLIHDYWGLPFMCVPSDILGFYCNLDSFYTLLLKKAREREYNEDCWRTFLDNIRLGARLHSSGLYINEPYRLRYSKYSKEQMAWGITYCAAARCWIKMEKHKQGMADIKRYSEGCRKLIERSEFFNGDPMEIAKYILLNNLTDLTDSGLNDGQLLLTYGQDFAENFVKMAKESMAEIKYVGKIDPSVKRKRKFLTVFSEKLKSYLMLDKLKIGKKHIELEKYVYYERAYKELTKVSKNQLTDINNVPDKVYIFGRTFDILEYSDYISNNYFKCKSPIENDEIIDEMFSLFKWETAYVAALGESIQQMPGTGSYYKDRNITTIQDGFVHFIKSWKSGVEEGIAPDYPDKMFDLSQKFYKGGIQIETAPNVKPVKDVWADFYGLNTMTTFFPQYKDDYLEYSKPFDPSDLDEKFFFMRKFGLNYLLYKKYAKVLSTYIDGMFKAKNKWVIEGPDHIPVREADPNEPGAIEKCFIHYEVNTKSSKRTSSAIHTAISHSDLKDCICTPHHYENGEIVFEPYLLTYFDISSAEVKASGFCSGDPDLIDKFNQNIDIYIYSAKLYLGEEGFDKLSKADKKMWRKRFKTIFLGVLYGLGKKSLAERLNATIEEADSIIQGLYSSFPQLRSYISDQEEYPFKHEGFINTVLGDKLKLKEYELWKKSTDPREKKNLEASIRRKAVNYPIQGGTSSIMSSGFFNDIRESIKQGWGNFMLQPIIVVHDSNTNYFPTSKVFEIRKFYDKYYSEFCAGFPPHIFLAFDLLTSTAYEKACDMKSGDNVIEFTGSAHQLLDMYDRIMNCPELTVKCSMNRDEIKPAYIQDAMQRFIVEKGTCLVKDLSRYTVNFEKIK